MDRVISDILASFDTVEIIENIQQNEEFDPYGNKKIFKYWKMNSSLYTMEILDKEGFNKSRIQAGLFILPDGTREFTHNRTATIRTLFEILTKK